MHPAARARSARALRDALDTLGPRGERVSVQQLFSSRVGKTVGKLCAHDDPGVARRARALVDAWKDAIHDAQTPVEAEIKRVLAARAPDEADELLELLAQLGGSGELVPDATLRSSLLGNTVRGLRSHPDAAVAAQAVAIVDAWKGRLRAAEKAEKKMVQSGAAALVAHLARGASSPAVEVQ